MLESSDQVAFVAATNLDRARAFYEQTLGLRVLEHGDFAASVRALAVQGAAFLRYDGMNQDDDAIWTTPSGDKVAWFADPDGNTLSLTQFGWLISGSHNRYPECRKLARHQRS